MLHAPVTEWLAKPVETQSGAAVLAFALVFGITFLAGKFLARALGDRTRKSILGPVDRVLGLGFGALKGLIGATLLFMLASLLYDTVYGGGAKRPEWMTTSRSYPLLNASRSEEHTSELQSLMRISYAVFCLKKKNKTEHTP